MALFVIRNPQKNGPKTSLYISDSYHNVVDTKSSGKSRVPTHVPHCFLWSWHDTIFWLLLLDSYRPNNQPKSRFRYKMAKYCYVNGIRMHSFVLSFVIAALTMIKMLISDCKFGWCTLAFVQRRKKLKNSKEDPWMGGMSILLVLIFRKITWLCYYWCGLVCLWSHIFYSKAFSGQG